MNGWNACPRGSMHAPGTHHVGNTSYWWLVHAPDAVIRVPGRGSHSARPAVSHWSLRSCSR